MFSTETAELTRKFLEARDRAEIATDPHGPEIQEMKKLAQELIAAEKKVRKDKISRMRKSIEEEVAANLMQQETELATRHKEKLKKAKSDAGTAQADAWYNRNLVKIRDASKKSLTKQLNSFDKKVKQYV